MISIRIPISFGVIFGGHAVYYKVAVVITVKSTDDVKHGGLTTARGTEYGNKVAFSKLEVYSFQRMYRVFAGNVIFLDVYKFKHPYPPL